MVAVLRGGYCETTLRRRGAASRVIRGEPAQTPDTRRTCFAPRARETRDSPGHRRWLRRRGRYFRLQRLCSHRHSRPRRQQFCGLRIEPEFPFYAALIDDIDLASFAATQFDFRDFSRILGRCAPDHFLKRQDVAGLDQNNAEPQHMLNVVRSDNVVHTDYG